MVRLDEAAERVYRDVCVSRLVAASLLVLLWPCAACGARSGTWFERAAASAGTGGSGAVSGVGGSSGSSGFGGGPVDAGPAGSGGMPGVDSGTAGASPGPAVVSVAAGSRHTCVLLDTGAVRCWGFGARGSLGYGNPRNIGDDELPADAATDVAVGGSAVQLVIGETQTCVLLATGNVRCWGAGTFGQLGYGHTLDIGSTVTPGSQGDVDIGGRALQIAAGHVHTCALLTDGAVRCWGYGKDGRLGYGNESDIGDDETPSQAGSVDVGGPVIELAAGGSQTCALLQGGAVRCWGAGDAGQLGYGNLDNVGDDESPSAAGDVDLGVPAVQIAAGSHHTCALLATGAVRCWGYGGSGRLGYGNTEHIGDDETPRAAGDIELGGPALRIDSSHDHTCALLVGGAVRCWGLGGWGRLGYGDTETIGNDETPGQAGAVDLGGSAVQIAVGTLHSCALLASGEVRCWGMGTYGRLGLGSEEDVGDDEVPADVPAVRLF